MVGQARPGKPGLDGVLGLSHPDHHRLADQKRAGRFSNPNKLAGKRVRGFIHGKPDRGFQPVRPDYFRGLIPWPGGRRDRAPSAGRFRRARIVVGSRLALSYGAGWGADPVVWPGPGFPAGEYVLAHALRYLRYFLVGFWVTGLAPLVFIRLGLAEEKEEKSPWEESGQL
jgi:hypothetical protein